MIGWKSAAFGAAAVMAATPAAARTVDYSRTEAQFREDATAIGAPTPAPAGAKSEVDVVLEDAEKLDHRLMILGISCSAWRVDNPLSQMVRRALADWDVDGSLEPVADRPLLRVSFASASSDTRCVQIRELDAPCQVRTRIRGQATLERPGREPVSQPFSIEDGQVDETPGACGSLSRGAGLSGRAASLALVERLRAMLAAD